MKDTPHPLECLQSLLPLEQVVPSSPPKLQRIPRLVKRVRLRWEITLARRQHFEIPAMNP